MKAISLFIRLLGLNAAVFFVGCSHTAVPVSSSGGFTKGSVGISSPACIVYLTRSDYTENVPVSMSPDKSKIVSFPDTRDIYFNGKLSVPTLLAKGYLLDNRGVGPDVAFLSYTYEEYSKLSSPPSATELMGRLLDKDPLTEMYQCGQRGQYVNIERELNELITSGGLTNCKKLR